MLRDILGAIAFVLLLGIAVVWGYSWFTGSDIGLHGPRHRAITASMGGEPEARAGRGLSREQQEQLGELLAKRDMEVLGPPEHQFGGFSQTKSLDEPPAANCVVAKGQHDDRSHGTFQRWDCN